MIYILFLNIRKTAANRLPHIQLMRLKRQQCLTTAIHHNTLFAKAAGACEQNTVIQETDKEEQRIESILAQ